MIQRIQKYIDHLAAIEYYDEDMEMSVFPDLNRRYCYDMSVTRCTCSAAMIADTLGGKIYGYEIDEDDGESIIGHCSLGHDFAVVGPYLVDWWAEHVNCCGKAILDMRKPDDIIYIQRHYLPLNEWVEIPVSGWLK